MNLHLHSTQFQELIQLTAIHFQLNSSLIEKDYWVTYILKQIYNSDLKHYTYFKGGTSLSKAYQIINRFSEDIDLLVYSNNPMASKQTEKNIAKELMHYLCSLSNLQYQEEASVIGGNYKKLLLQYTHHFSFAGLKEHLEIEITTPDIPNKANIILPCEITTISSYIAQYLSYLAQNKLINKYQLQPVSVLVVKPNKTLCDKIARLCRISAQEDYLPLLIKYNRDLYDVDLILKDKQYRQYCMSDDFRQQLNQVILEDQHYKKCVFSTPFYETPLFRNPEKVILNSNVKQALLQTQNNLTFDRKLDVTSIISAIRFIYNILHI